MKKTLVKKDLLLIEKDDLIKKLEGEINRYRQIESMMHSKSTRKDSANQSVTPSHRRILELPTEPSQSSLQIKVGRDKSRPKSSSRCLTPTTRQELLGL